MKYPGTFLARQSGYIAFFLVYNNILETRSHISFLVSFLHFPKTTYPSYSTLDQESRDVVSELLLVWMVPQCMVEEGVFCEWQQLWTDGAPPSGWVLLPFQSLEIGWDSTDWILVSTCLLAHRPLHSAQSVHLFLHLSWDSGAALLSASCVTSCV